MGWEAPPKLTRSLHAVACRPGSSRWSRIANRRGRNAGSRAVPIERQNTKKLAPGNTSYPLAEDIAGKEFGLEGGDG